MGFELTAPLVVLAIEDDEFLRSLAVTKLQKEGYQIEVASDGEEGLDLAEKHDGVDLVISDLRLPMIDGLTMVEKLRKLEKYKTIPVVMITTEAGAEYKRRGKELSVRAWIQKPLNFEVVESVLGKIIVK